MTRTILVLIGITLIAGTVWAADQAPKRVLKDGWINDPLPPIPSPRARSQMIERLQKQVGRLETRVALLEKRQGQRPAKDGWINAPPPKRRAGVPDEVIILPPTQDTLDMRRENARGLRESQHRMHSEFEADRRHREHMRKLEAIRVEQWRRR